MMNERDDAVHDYRKSGVMQAREGGQVISEIAHQKKKGGGEKSILKH